MESFKSWIKAVRNRAQDKALGGTFSQAPDVTGKIIDSVLAAEGGFQDDPDDTGNFWRGELIGTNFGITPQAYAAYYGKAPTKQDMEQLTKQQAAEIYREEYVKAPGYESLPAELAPHVVDMGVNSGPPRATKLLQRVVGVEEDGSLGPITLAAVKAYDGDLVAGYKEARRQYYQQLAKAESRRPRR